MHPVRVSALLLSLFCALAASRAQTSRHAPNPPPRADVFEDDEVRIPIPPGWERTFQFSRSSHDSFQGLMNGKPYDVPITGTLLLYKDGYTLTLAYDTQQASGIIGGRSIEIFEIPWAAGSDFDTWGCANSFPRVPQPATRSLLFENLIVDTDRETVRKDCNLQSHRDPSETSPSPGELRWFGGYFTAVDGAYFSDQDCGQHCYRELAYTLTTSARKAEQLPRSDDPHLAGIVQQAIDIVDSIQYKVGPPKRISPLRYNLP